MRQTLRAGAEIDTLTQEEMNQSLAPLVQALEQDDDYTFRVSPESALVATAAGALNAVELLDVPVGFEMRIHRYHFNAPGATPSAPVNSGWLEFFENSADSPGGLFMFFPVAGTAIAPVVVNEGKHNAKLLAPGTKVFITGAGLPANQILYVTLQVSMHKAKSKVGWLAN